MGKIKIKFRKENGINLCTTAMPSMPWALCPGPVEVSTPGAVHSGRAPAARRAEQGSVTPFLCFG